jgi:hypothetical protein
MSEFEDCYECCCGCLACIIVVYCVIYALFVMIPPSIGLALLVSFVCVCVVLVFWGMHELARVPEIQA